MDAFGPFLNLTDFAMITPLGKKVLLVDDEVASRNLYQLSLERCGVSVFTANGATEALRYFEAFRFDAVIIDLDLEDGHGVNLAGQIKSLRPETRTIGITGNPKTAHLDESRCQGQVDVFHSRAESVQNLVDQL